MVSARISLPLPVSPTSSTLSSPLATSMAVWRNRIIAGSTVTMPWNRSAADLVSSGGHGSSVEDTGRFVRGRAIANRRLPATTHSHNSYSLTATNRIFRTVHDRRLVHIRDCFGRLVHPGGRRKCRAMIRREVALGALAGLMLAVAVAVAGYLLRATPDQRWEPAADELTSPARRAPDRQPRAAGFVGVLLAGESVDIEPRSEGRIDEVLVKPGDRVLRGAPIARLDVRAIVHQLAIARAALAGASHRYTRRRLVPEAV